MPEGQLQGVDDLLVVMQAAACIEQMLALTLEDSIDVAEGQLGEGLEVPLPSLGPEPSAELGKQHSAPGLDPGSDVGIGDERNTLARSKWERWLPRPRMRLNAITVQLILNRLPSRQVQCRTSHVIHADGASSTFRKIPVGKTEHRQ